jgi:hypothetical protein
MRANDHHDQYRTLKPVSNAQSALTSLLKRKPAKAGVRTLKFNIRRGKRE